MRASSSASSTPASTRPTRPSRTCVPVADGGDGYDHTNPLGAGNYLGMCDPANTDAVRRELGLQRQAHRLLQLREPAADGDPTDDVYDDDGHGSHTGSTTAGNQVEATAYSAKGTEHEFSVTSTIKGVAPHANIIGYDVCDGGCQGYSILASIDQAILDGVDVINYSIGSSAASNPWTDARRRRASSTLAPPASTSPPRPATTVPVPPRSAAPATCRG